MSTYSQLFLLQVLLPSCVFACIQGRHAVPEPKSVVFRFPVDRDVLKPAPPTIQPFTSVEPVSEEQANEIYRKTVAAYESKPAGTPTIEETIDYTAALLFLGQTEKAIVVLVALERDHPGFYATASNLGTAYELAGDLLNALKWIKEGIARNSASHHGTEWLHVAILEAKLQHKEAGDWFTRHSVLDLAMGHPPSEILKAIEYQLNERLQFIAPEDPVMCDLFYQAALRVEGPDAASLRAAYLKESLRFGSLRKVEIEKLLES